MSALIMLRPLNWNTIGRFIFCRCRRTAHTDGSGPEAGLPSSFGVLSRENVSICSHPGVSLVYPLYCCPTTRILSTEIRRVGEHALVLELSYQPYICNAGYDATSVGRSIHHDHSAATVQSTKKSTGSRALFGFRRRVSRCVGG